MRWLVTGATGQLGTELVRLLTDAGDDVVGVGRAQLDVTDSIAVDALIASIRPDVVVNAAAYTAVDAAETDELAAYAGNATAPANLAAALSRHGGSLIHISTDYVFAGDASAPYEVDDEPDPQSVYGRTKLAGELAVRELLPERSYVVRTAWVYGPTGGNFVKTMVRLEGERETVSVVDDQRGSPTWAPDLAAGLIELGRSVGTVPAGIYHLTNAGDTTWFGFTQAIFEELGTDVDRVLPTSSADFIRPARRPAYSVMSDRSWTAAGLTPLRQWREALRTAFTDFGPALKPVGSPAAPTL